ncbi:MAG TPA: gamma-glutamyl-gamma-aminobutyrate hydrolase family protein [Levilinea sp.]|nr:gamma-glutamyl-gamma-aminobutyrate hydrolase family protein [Levilinea sp.]
MTAPLIGITMSHTRNHSGGFVNTLADAYVGAVAAAGGIPVLLPAGIPLADVRTLRSQLSGILLSGGSDVAPSRFGGYAHPRVYGVDEARDALEIELVHVAVQTGWPLLAICRGIQIFNVALGGTLFTHIADQLERPLEHDNGSTQPRDYLAHTVQIASGSLLEHILVTSETAVNSMHHQGIDQLSPCLQPAAFTSDGLIEGVELPRHPFALGVQWHPECMPESAQMKALFSAFVITAGMHMDRNEIKTAATCIAATQEASSG